MLISIQICIGLIAMQVELNFFFFLAKIELYLEYGIGISYTQNVQYSTYLNFILFKKYAMVGKNSVHISHSLVVNTNVCCRHSYLNMKSQNFMVETEIQLNLN